MARPLLRVKIAGEAFGFRAAVAPSNRPMLARGNEIGKRIAEWLGRFAAKPAWTGDTIEFYVCDESGRELAGLAGSPVSPDELRGALRREFADLQTCLKEAAAKATQDKPLYDHLCRGLLDGPSGALPAFAQLGCQFFQYRDVRGRVRLAWCYGYEPQVARGDARSVVCVNEACLHLHQRQPGAEPKCPRCGRVDEVPPPPRRGRKMALALLVLLVLVASLAGGAAYWFRPSSVVEGQIARQGDGAPISGAVVHLEGAERQTQTDDAGRFRLDALPAGPHRLSVQAPGFTTSTKDVDLQRHATTSVELSLAGAARIVGQVVHMHAGKESPVPGATVRVAGPDEKDAASEARTDEQGKFTIAEQFPGAVKLSVAADGFHSTNVEGEAAVESPPELKVALRGSQRIAGRIVYAVDDKLTVAEAEVRVAGAEDAPVRSDVSGGFMIRDVAPGEVTLEVKATGLKPASRAVRGGDLQVTIPLEGDATLVGEVLRADTKAPVANAEVRLPGTPFVARTSDSGKFRMTGVRSGPARINATAPGLAAVVTREIEAAQETSVQLLLAGTLTASGRVLKASDKQPLAGATVTVAELGIKVTTDAAGKFQLPGLAQGTLQVVAAAPAMFPATVSFTASAERATLDDIELRPAADVRGKVVTGKDRRPLAGVTLSVAGVATTATTNEQGEFRLFPLPPGATTVAASADDYFPVQREVELAAGEQTLDEFALARLASLQGRVLRAYDRKPLAGARVALKETGERVETNADGAYRFAQAPAGVVTIATAAVGFETLQWRQTLRAGDQQLEDALLEGAVAARGVVVDAFNKKSAVPGVTLQVVMGDHRTTLESQRNGGFDLGKLPTDALVEIVASKPGYLDAKLSKRVTSDDAWLEIPLPKLLNVVGVTVNADTQAPLAKARVVTTTRDGLQKLTTDAKGQFQLKEIPAGSLSLQVEATGFAAETVTVTVEPGVETLTVPLKPLRRFQGSIADAADDRKGVPNAQVRFTIGGFEGSATAGPLGSFEVELPKGQGSVEVSAPGYMNLSENVVIGSERRTLIYKLSRGRRVAGMVVNAVNNQPLPEARVELTPVSDPALASSTTDEHGQFAIAQAPLAAKQLRVSAAGFEPQTLDLPAATSEGLRIVLSPRLEPGEARVVVTWSTRGKDLDAHLFCPAEAGRRAHVSFEQRNVGGAQLDLDAKKAPGPETITLRSRPGTYSYLVVHHDTLGEAKGDRLAESEAQVRVYVPGPQSGQVFTLPAKVTGPAWHVLDLVVDEQGAITVKPVQRFSKDLPAE